MAPSKGAPHVITSIKIARLAKAGAGAVTLALAFSACGSDGGSTSKPNQSTNKGSGSLSATLNASGSSFQKNLEENAIKAFQAANSGVTINYAGGGSSKGKSDLAAKLVDFAGTDSAVKPEDLGKFNGASLLYFPIAAAPITVTYKLDGVTKLLVGRLVSEET